MARGNPNFSTELTYLSPFVHQGALFRYHKTSRFLNNGKISAWPGIEFTFNRIINIAIRIIQSEKFFNQHVITIFIFTFPIQNITTLIHHNISTVCLLSFQNFKQFPNFSCKGPTYDFRRMTFWNKFLVIFNVADMRMSSSIER